MTPSFASVIRHRFAPSKMATVIISDGNIKLFAPKIKRQTVAQKSPIIPGSLDLLARICSMKITVKSAVIEKSIPVKSILISCPASEPITEPIIQYIWSNRPIKNRAFPSSTPLGTVENDEFTPYVSSVSENIKNGYRHP